MNHQEYQDLLALHALDALDASDARALDEHLATCEQCRHELDELRNAAGLLAHAELGIDGLPGLHDSGEFRPSSISRRWRVSRRYRSIKASSACGTGNEDPLGGDAQ